MTPEIVLDLTPEEWEKEGSKFAQVGRHLSTFSMPTIKTPGVSLDFPFTITDPDDPDNGKEGSIFGGIQKGKAFKTKEILESIEVAFTDVGGKLAFNTDDVVGKQAYIEWVMQKDSRPTEQGGTGNTYTKPIKSWPLSAGKEDKKSPAAPF